MSQSGKIKTITNKQAGNILRVIKIESS